MVTSTPILPPDEPARPARSDGQLARERLLAEALRLFSEQGFARTSTRAIAQAAGANISAISYYFGDKQGLYRCAFLEPMSGHNVQAQIDDWNHPGLSLEQALHRFYSGLLAPLEQGEAMRHCLRLHMREMLDPTGLWQHEIEHSLRPIYHALWDLVGRHLGLAQVDEDLQRLTLAMCGMPIHLLAVQDMVQTICPALQQGPSPVARAVDKLVRYALALIDSEARARGLPSPVSGAIS
ncbi:CerR family C-terminal domain-containing protein [Brachymonas denitrificans]|uniref:CerR family C-terminal domain-containing protein n=1 Tax=Brachymonas denitrificans TaxID=28220 RepID=UPI001BCC0AF7|nr:CerR family C-terminal domain-containing protein [Brachymonas denitrificans]